MNTLEFNQLPTTERKMLTLKTMREEEKIALVKEQEIIIEKIWNKCLKQTYNKLQKEFKTIDNRILYLDYLLAFADWTIRKYNFETRIQKSIFQWDIFYCDLGHNIGHEKNKTRPVLIIQRMRDYIKSGTVMVAPITIGSDFDNLYKHEIILDITKYGKIRGKIDLSHIRSVSKSRLDKYPKDRLLNENEYANMFKDTSYTTIQSKIKNALKYIFALD